MFLQFGLGLVSICGLYGQENELYFLKTFTGSTYYVKLFRSEMARKMGSLNLILGIGSYFNRDY